MYDDEVVVSRISGHEDLPWDLGMSAHFVHKKIGGALKGVAGVALPIAGGLFGGPLGAAIGSGIGGLISGGEGQAAQNQQVQDLQRRSAADQAARAPLRNVFTQGIQDAANISAPDLTGRLGGTTQAQTGLIGQNLGLGAGTGELAGQRLGQAGDLFGQAGGAAGQAGELFRGSVSGLPEFGGIGTGTGDVSRGLNQQAVGKIGGANISGFRDIGLGQGSDRLNQAAESRIGGPGQLPGFQGVGPGTGDASRTINQQALGLAGGGQLPQFQGIGAGQFGSSSQTRGLEGQAIGAVGSALGAPGIGAAAQGQLQNIFEQSADERKIGSRDIGRSAAAFGRVGSGVVNTQLGDLEERIQRGQQQAFRGLAGDTAQAEASDRLARASLGLGAAGQFQGRDLSTAGFQQGLRGEARGERGQEFGQSLAGAGLGLDQARTLDTLGGNQFSRDAILRGEARGERGEAFGQAQARAGLGLQQAGALQGLGAQQFGQQQALRGQDVGERASQFGQELAGGRFGIDQGQALSGIGQTQFGQDSSLRAEARGERGAGLDEAFRRAQLGQQAGQGLLGVSGAQGELGSRVGQLGALGQGLDLERLQSQRGERGFQAGQDQQQFQNRNQVFSQEQGALGQQQNFELDRLRQAGQIGFGGAPGGIGFGDLGVLNNLTDTQNTNIQQQQDLAAGIGDFFGGGQQQQQSGVQSFDPNFTGGFNPPQNIFGGQQVGQFGVKRRNIFAR